MQTFSVTDRKYVETPKKVIQFFNEIQSVCKKYNMSISHEDIHGAFEIDSYKEFNIEWLRMAHILFSAKEVEE